MGYDLPIKEKSPESVVVYALYVEVSDLYALTLDATTGALLQNLKVSGYDNHGETSRLWTFDERRELFYLLEVDFLTTPESNLTLYIIDPTTAKVQALKVKGTNDRFPTAYYYHCPLDTIFVATQPFDEQTTAPFSFYKVDPTTAQATFVSNSSVSGDGLYSGWFHSLSDDGHSVYRLGYRDPLNEQDPGFAVTDISSVTASTSWNEPVPVPASHDWYVTASCFPSNDTVGSSGSFYSLSERTTSGNKGLDLVKWSIGTGSSATVVGSFGNDNTVRFFGSIAQTLSCDKSVFSSALYLQGKAPIDDKWELAILDIPTGQVTNVDVAKLLGETSAVAGIGVPYSSQLVLHDQTRQAIVRQ